MATPLRGRVAETAQLVKLLDRLGDGLGVCALVLGEAGVGKSRLMDELTAVAERRERRVVRINADEIDLMSPLSTLLRGLTRADALSGVGPLLDEAAASRPADIWLLNEIQSQLERAAVKAPLVVIIDDVDRADDLSLHAVRLLSHSLESSAIAWLMTARAEFQPRLSRLRGSIARSGGSIMTLQPLGDADAIQLVEDIIGSPPQASLVDLALAAGGNALLLTELAHGFLVEGRQATLGGVDGGPKLPARVREAIRSRVTAMPPDAIQVLEVAAVLGRSFRVADLAAVVRTSPAQAMSAVRPLLSEGMITERDGQLLFRHDLLREAVLDDLPAEAVRLTHREAAAALLAKGEPPVDVAVHLLAGAGAGDASLAEAATSAGERLVSASPERAVQLARKALEICADEPRRWLEIAPRVAMLLTQAGRLDEALDVLSLAGARGIDGDSEAFGRAALCDALWRQSRTAEAVSVIRPVLRREDISVPGRLRLEVAWARTQVLGGQPGQAVEQLGRSIRTARELGDNGVLSSALASRSMALRFVGRFADSLADGQEAAAVRRMESAWRGVDPRVWLARSLAAVDQVDEAEALCRDLMRDANGATAARDLPAVSATSARLLLSRGQIAEARTEAEAGIAAMEAGGSRELAADLYACAAVTAWLEAGPTAALEALERIDRTTEDNTFGMHHVELVRVLIDGGHDASAVAELAAPMISGPADSYGQLVFDPFHGPAVVRCLVTAGLTAEADIVVRKCRELAAMNPGIASWQAASDQAEGLRTADAALLQGAVDLFEKSGRHLAAALASYDAVSLRGRRRSGTDRERSAASLRGLGAHALAEQVVARRQQRGLRPASGWASLTPAELRVVELAAAGATNKEIAQRLWISPYTVDTHLRHSLAKLGLRSRVALARAAAEQMPARPGAN